MTLDVAIILFIVAVAGLVLTYKFVPKTSKFRTVCLVLLSLIAIALAGYIAITIYFVDAVRHQPADF